MIQKLQHHNGKEYLRIDFKDFSVEFELGEDSRIRYIKGETTTYLANDFTITIDEDPKFGILEILIKNEEASFKWIGHDLEGMFMFIARRVITCAGRHTIRTANGQFSPEKSGLLF